MIIHDRDRRGPTNARQRRAFARLVKNIHRWVQTADAQADGTILWARTPWDPLSLSHRVMQTLSAGVRDSVTPSQQ